MARGPGRSPSGRRRAPSATRAGRLPSPRPYVRSRRARPTGPAAAHPPHRVPTAPQRSLRVHHPPHPPGHLRHGVLHPLARLAVRDGRPGGRRQRLRRGRRRRVRAARRRAASERARRARCRSSSRPAGGARAGAVRAGPGAGRGDRRRTTPALGLDLVPGTGPLAAAVPGAFDAWMLLLRDHGTKSLAEVLRYAIGYAEHGHPAVERVGETVETVRELFETEWTSSAEVYLPGGTAAAPGELFRNPALAATWRRLIAEARGGAAAGPRGADRGGPRGSGARASSPRRSLTRRPGPPWTPAANATPAPSPAPTWPAGPRPTRPRHVRLERLDRVQGRAAGARARPSSSSSPCCRPELPAYGTRRVRPPAHRGLQARHGRPGGLVRRRRRRAARRPARRAGYNAARRALVGERRLARAAPRQPRTAATPRLQRARRRAVARRPDGAGLAASRRRGAPATAGASASPTVATDGATRGDTCHLDVVDRWGNMVAATPSGGWLQSNPVVPELGFPLGTRLQMAWLERGPAQLPDPGPPPAHHPHPVARAARRRAGAWPSARPAATSRTSGSCTSSWPSRCARAVRGGLDLQGAIDAPNWHNDSFPGSFYPRGMRPGSVTVESRIGARRHRGAAPARPRRHGRRRLVRGAAVRGRAGPGDRGAVRRGEPAGDAGVRGRALRRCGAGRVRAPCAPGRPPPPCLPRHPDSPGVQPRVSGSCSMDT